MTQRKLLYKNLFQVAFSRGSTLLSNIAIGFLLPRSLGVTGYGYYRVYALYFTYTALLHLGFIDGVLLRFAGKDYDSLDKSEMRAYTRFFGSFTLITSLLVCLSAVFISNSEYSFIAVVIGIEMFLNNMTLYYMYISQATKRFKEYSVRNIASAVIKLVLVIVLYAIYLKGGTEVSYRIYLIAVVFIDAALFLWYVYTYRELTFGSAVPVASLKSSIIGLFKTGFIIMIAYQVAHLVFILDNQFVSVFYDTDTFAVYAFAYSIITAVSSLISSTSAVLLPMLKSLSGEGAMRYYDRTLTSVTCVAGLAMVLMYPLEWFIGWFLPKYAVSIDFLKIIMPSLMLSACISVVMFTFYKVLDKQRIYLYVGLGALCVGFVSNALAQWIFASPYAISWASVITVLLWYWLASFAFIKNYGHRPLKNFAYIAAISGAFYCATFARLPWWLAAAVYLFAYAVITTLFYHKTVRQLITRDKGA